MNRKLTIRGFQRNQNYEISPCILGVIALKVNAQIHIENEHQLVKRQIEGPNVDEILRIKNPRKAD